MTTHLNQETRLPRNGKEGALFGGIIVILTATLMSTISTIRAVGEFNGDVALDILKILPIMFVIAMVLEGAVIGRIAEKLVTVFTAPTDSFNSKILFRIVFTVFGMSACMTFIGGIVGNGFNSDSFSNWLSNWPINFLIVFLAESLVIQPIARFAMVKLHASQEKKSQSLQA